MTAIRGGKSKARHCFTIPHRIERPTPNSDMNPGLKKSRDSRTVRALGSSAALSATYRQVTLPRFEPLCRQPVALIAHSATRYPRCIETYGSGQSGRGVVLIRHSKARVCYPVIAKEIDANRTVAHRLSVAARNQSSSSARQGRWRRLQADAVVPLDAADRMRDRLRFLPIECPATIE